MEVLYSRCAGLDVHKDTVVAAVRIAADATVDREVKSFGTTTGELMKLADWLMEHGCSHVAMEATGVYWKPVWAVLESAEAFELVLANAHHVRNVPGRKTDVNDATWLSDLLAHGLIRASFVPPAHVQQMRDLSRTRKQLVREITAHTLRIQKVLETANIKLSSVLSDVLGKSGRAILDAIVSGISDPQVLVKLVSPKVKASSDTLAKALRGRVTDHHRFLLKVHLQQVDNLNEAVRELEERLGDALEPFRDKVELIVQIPGFDTQSARALLSEIGTDVTRFARPEHLVSWACLCPRLDESAGKHRNTRTRKGARWLRPLLVQAAWNAVRTKNSYLRAKYHRLRARRGTKKAIVAVAASMLRAIWHMLRGNHPFNDLGPAHYEQQDTSRIAKRLVRKLEGLGYKVSLAA